MQQGFYAKFIEVKMVVTLKALKNVAEMWCVKIFLPSNLLSFNCYFDSLFRNQEPLRQVKYATFLIFSEYC